MDVLTDVLNALELKGWLASRTELVAPWRVDFATSRDGIFHIFNSGSGYLSIEGEAAPIPVKDGDVIVLPHGHAHTICDELTSPLIISAHFDHHTYHGYNIFPFEGEGPKTALLCGLFHFEYPDDSPLLRCLPSLIHIPGEQGCMVPEFADIVRLIAREAASPRSGAESLLRRLAELLFIQVIRIWIDQQAEAFGGWIAALGDQSISTALGLIHQSPEHGWKVGELADAVALSRTAFSTRFTQLVGEPPMKYLTRWRMHKAKQLLKNNVKVEMIAQQLGYDSEIVFRKAFKREVGMTPAHYRKPE